MFIRKKTSIRLFSTERGRIEVENKLSDYKPKIRLFNSISAPPPAKSSNTFEVA